MTISCILWSCIASNLIPNSTMLSFAIQDVPQVTEPRTTYGQVSYPSPLAQLQGLSTSITKSWLPAPSHWIAKCQPTVDAVLREVDEYFLRHWPFPSERAGKKFIAAGFSRVTCLYFPLAQDDRIGFACRLLTVLFLIDGELPGFLSLSIM